jgi:hypothetical protein
MLTHGGLISGKMPVDYGNIVDLRYLTRAEGNWASHGIRRRRINDRAPKTRGKE